MRSIRLRRIVGLLLVLPGFLSLAWALGTQDEKAQFAFAQRLYEDASYANAAQEYRRFIVNFPSSDRLPEANFRLGEAQVRAQHYDEAIQTFQEFIDRYPSHLDVAVAMRQRAAALHHLGKYTNAGAAFQEVQAAFPASEYAPQDLLSAGDSFHRGTDLKAAEDAFRSLMDRYPASPLVHEAVYRLGRVLLDAGRSEEALNQFGSLAEASGVSERKPDALLEIGKVHLAREDLAKAESTFSELREAFPKDDSAERAYLVLGSWYSGKQEWKRAIDTYTKALQVLPRNERRQQAVLGLAGAHREIGNSDRALTYYTEFLKAYPGSPFLPEARLGLGRAYADLGNFRAALDAFTRLLERFPDVSITVQAHREMGDIWRRLGMPRKALLAYQTHMARVEDPGARASSLLQTARIYEQDLQWYDLAEQSYRKLLASPTPLSSDGRYGLAHTFERKHEPGLALREYRIYLEEHPDGGRAAEAEARIRYLREFAPREVGTAAEDVIALVAGLPSVASDPQAQFQLGRHLYGRRMYRLASDCLTRALAGEQATSSAPEARYLLGRTYLKLSLQAELEERLQVSSALRDSGLSQYRAVLSDHPESRLADDATLALIAEETAGASPDSLRGRRMLQEYRRFEEGYSESDRLDVARVRIAEAHLLLGATDASHMDSALAVYRRVRREFPQSPTIERAVYGIGTCLARKKQYVRAEETLRDFLVDYPRSDLAGRARYELGRILLAREYYRSAAVEFAELLRAPTSLELERSARALLAESYFRAGDYDQAIRIDEGLLRRGPDPAVLRRLARSYRKSDRHEEAVRSYASFLRAFPNAADADTIAFSRAKLLASLGRLPEATAAFRDVPDRYPDSPLRVKADLAVGDILFETGQYRDAVRVFGSIPRGSWTASMAGREVLSYFRTGRIKEARKKAKSFKKAYRGENSWLALFEVEEGLSQLKAGNPKKARSTLEDILKDYPDTEAAADASYHLVAALKAEGRGEDYIAALGSFVRKHRSNRHWSSAALELADFYSREGDLANASRHYQEVLANDLPAGQRPQVLWKLVDTYAKLKFYDNAIGYARILVEESPQHGLAAQARVRIGELYHDKGDHKRAIQELTPQLKISKGNDWSTVQHTIARSYFLMGDHEGAKTEFLKLLYNYQGSPNWIANAHWGLADAYEARGEYRQVLEELEKIRTRFGSSSTFGSSAGERIRNIQSLIDGGGRPGSSQ